MPLLMFHIRLRREMVIIVAIVTVPVSKTQPVIVKQTYQTIVVGGMRRAIDLVDLVDD